MRPGVLHLIKGLGRGGAEQLLVDAVRHLDRDRHRYEVAYLLPWKDALVGELRSQGVAVHGLEGGSGTAWLGRLRRLVKERGIGLLHTHSPYPAIGARTVVGGAHHVYTEHNVWQRYHRATYWGNLATFFRNAYVFTVSDQVRTSIRYPSGLGFLTMPPVETLYHGLDMARMEERVDVEGVRRELGISEDAPLVGTVGNFTPKKAHRDLIEAVSAIRRSLPEVRLVLVGHGPLEGDLRSRVRDLGLESSVTFAGYRTDATRLAAALDVFVLPSRFEGLSIAMLEAMALGRAVVATRVGGSPEVVEDGESGILVEAGDPGALAEAIGSLLRDPSRRARMGEAARRRAGRFDIGAAAARMEEVYEGLLGEPG
jgi:glycosyltransferase involved in cell wall biosynthesis